MRTTGTEALHLGAISSVVGDSDLMGGAPVQHWIGVLLVVWVALAIVVTVGIAWWKRK